jgi:hypothetical protein
MGFDFIDQIQNNIEYADSESVLQLCCKDFLSSLQKFTTIDSKYSSNDIITIYEQFNSNSRSFQNHLYSLTLKTEQQNVNNNLTATNDVDLIAWYKSVSVPEAGMWMTTIPKAEKYEFDSALYRTALRYRFHIQQSSEVITRGLACDCSNHPKLDYYGHHLTTGCGRDGYRHRTHDFVGMEIIKIVKYSGLYSIREEVNCLQTVNDPDSHRRPDISVLGAPKHLHRKLIMDVCITNPLPGTGNCTPSGLTKNESLQQSRAAIASFKKKIYSYKNILNEKNLDFLPFIFESSGLIHSSAKDFLLSLAQLAEQQKKIKAATLYNFFLKNISITLQKRQAAAILGRSSQLRSRSSRHEVDYTLSHDFVLRLDDYLV